MIPNNEATSSDRMASLPPHPASWYCVGLSTWLPHGGVRAVALAGQEIVLFRDDAGKASALDAHCPHLGAHLGYGGRVVGGALRCPFHGFSFDGDGACVGTAYGQPPPRCRLRSWRLREVDGLIFVFYHERSEDPTWEVPSYQDANWTPYRMFAYTLRGHVQDVIENAIDAGHFAVLHGLDTQVTEPLRVEEQHLSMAYRGRRSVVFGPSGRRFDVSYRAHVHGLGFILADAMLHELGVAVRNVFLPRPLAAGQMVFQCAISLRRGATRIPILGRLPWWLLEKILIRSTLRGVRMEVQKDLPIWDNKIYQPRPMLVQGDGPILPFRRWARQFYSTPDGPCRAS